MTTEIARLPTLELLDRTRVERDYLEYELLAPGSQLAVTVWTELVYLCFSGTDSEGQRAYLHFDFGIGPSSRTLQQRHSGAHWTSCTNYSSALDAIEHCIAAHLKFPLE
jgi:hypothetical protein